MRHLDKTTSNERKIPHRPVPFEDNWGEKYITHGLEYWRQDIRSIEKLPLVAQYFGFEDQWKLYEEAEETSNDLSMRIKDMILMKAKFANKGKGGMAVSCSPREGMHRTIALTLKMMGCRFNPVEGWFTKPNSLDWKHFAKAGLMKEWKDITEDEKRQLGTVQAAVRSHVLEAQSPSVNAEFCFFNVPPEVASSEQLVFACKEKSKEISDSKRHSAKPALFSMIYQEIIKPISCKDDIEKFIAKPSLQFDNRYNNEVLWTPNEVTARKHLNKDSVIERAFRVAPILYTPESLNYFKNPFDREAETAFVKQFPSVCEVNGKKRTFYPPFFYDKEMLFDCPLTQMNHEHINRCWLFPKVHYIYCQNEGIPVDGTDRPSDSLWYFQIICYTVWFHLSVHEEKDYRIQTHGCMGHFSTLGGGAFFLNNNAILGGLIYVTISISLLFYRETLAIYPFVMKDSTKDLQRGNESVAILKQRFHDMKSGQRKWMAQSHLHANTPIRPVEMLKVLGVYLFPSFGISFICSESHTSFPFFGISFL